MKIKKTVTALITITAMAVPVFVNAGGTGMSGTYTADVKGGTIKVVKMGGYIGEDEEELSGIVGYEGNPVELEIPSEFELEPRDNISTSYTGEEKIRKGAFKDCNSLKKITLCDKRIEEGAFENCDNLETVVFAAKDEEELSKNPGNRDQSTVYSGAFKNCKSLKTLIIMSKDGITSLNSEAIKNEDGSIGYTGCTMSEAFEGCPIETIVLPEKYDDYDKANYKGYRMPYLKGSTTLKNINIPYGTYRLQDTFEGCISLENIEIPETVAYVGETFKNCTNLKEVKFLGNETPFIEKTFENCPNVTIVCNTDSLAAEKCKEYGIKAVDFNGNIISGSTETPQPTTSSQETKNDEISVILNGNNLSFDQTPVIENGTTLVPMRAIFEAMGASVEWDGATQTVTSVKDDTTISLTLNKETATVNSNSISLAVPAKLINGNTMVPLRFVSESLGAEVNWDGTSRTITINN